VLMGLPSGSRIWLAAGVTDLRKGMDGLSALVQTALQESPYSGHIFVFRGRRGDKVKVLWHSGDGVCLFCKRLSDGRFVWPQTQSEGIDWRRPKRTAPAPEDPDRVQPTRAV
jgi:transposase